MFKKNYVKALQFLIGIALITFLLNKIDKGKITDLISQVPLHYLYLALFLLFCQLAISAYRWLLIIRFSGFSLSFFECFGSCAISSLVNTTLPVAIAGDFMRMWLVSRKGIQANVAINSVFTDRILNTVMLGLIVIFVLLPYVLLTQSAQSINIYMWSLIYSACLLVGLLFLLFVIPLLLKFKIGHQRFFKFLIHLSHINRTIFQPSSQFLLFIMVTILGHLLSFSTIIILASSLHVSLSLWQYLICASTVLLFSAIPITPGGWGVREGAMLLALTPFHVNTEVALSISIIFGIGLTAASIPGAIGWLAYWLGTNRSKTLILTNESS